MSARSRDHRRFGEMLALTADKPEIDWPRPLEASIYKPVGLDRQIEQARRECGEKRWARLQQEWSQ